MVATEAVWGDTVAMVVAVGWRRDVAPRVAELGGPSAAGEGNNPVVAEALVAVLAATTAAVTAAERVGGERGETVAVAATVEVGTGAEAMAGAGRAAE